MYKYPKKIRLRSKKLIGKLFDEGNAISKYPLRLVWIEVDELPEDVFLQTAVSVSKKRFKRAVKRNLLKRRMREAIRLNILDLENYLRENNKKLVFMLIYTSNDIKSYADIEKSFKRLVLGLIDSFGI
ncbi:MAG: ribonuclease P protein component [Bacteroidales bacterium]|nr:ribonuclease P protein component [Bacteroidales bacterium]